MSQYFRTKETEQYTFYRIPKVLFSDKHYKDMATETKLLYGILLDRMGLSLESGWIDEKGRAYIYFAVKNLEEFLDFKRDKTRKLFRELEGKDLLERKHQSQNRHDRLYLKKFIAECDYSAVRDAENTLSGELKNQSSECENSAPNKTEKNNIEFNNINLSIGKERIDKNDEIKKQNPSSKRILIMKR